MVTIALCDDEDGQRLEIAKLLKEYRAARLEAKLRETAFSSSGALLEQVRKTGGFDLYLLDVIMPEQDGIALGLELRELDRGAVIIYLTSSPDYAVESYRTRAFYYLLKPVERERFFAVLDEAMELIQRERGATVPVKTKDGLQMLPVRAIQYGERAERCAVYMLADGSRVRSVTLRGSFKEAVAALLKDRRFVLCSASFVVNLDFVTGLEKCDLYLESGMRIPLSRTCRKQVLDRWMDRCLERG